MSVITNTTTLGTAPAPPSTLSPTAVPPLISDGQVVAPPVVPTTPPSTLADVALPSMTTPPPFIPPAPPPPAVQAGAPATPVLMSSPLPPPPPPPTQFAGAVYSPLLDDAQHRQVDSLAPLPPPKPAVPTTPVELDIASPAIIEEHTATTTIEKVIAVVHFILLVCLIGEGLLGLYGTIRFIAVDFPAFDSSVTEFGYNEDVLNHFIQKASMMVMGTALSFFVVVHALFFHRTKTSPLLLGLTILAAAIVGGIMWQALQIKL